MFQRLQQEIALRWKRTIRPSPFRDGEKSALLLHCGYHRGGTTWFHNVMSGVAHQNGLRFQNCEQRDLRGSTDLWLCNDSIVDSDALPAFRGTHLIRDPRDLIVSGYFFHLKASEPWLLRPDPQWGGLCYQEHLRRLSETEGFKAEITRTLPTILRMQAWNYAQPDFLELRYEDVIQDQYSAWERILRHYGFSEDAIHRARVVVEKYSIEKVRGKLLPNVTTPTHIRSGKAQQWRRHFTPEVKAFFQKATGNALVALGYEQTTDW